MNNIAVFGEALFDFIEQPSGTFDAVIGGSPYNVAKGLARQGLNPYYVSPISSDHLGEKIIKDTDHENITLPLNNRSNRKTSLALVYLDSNGLPDYSLYRENVADLDITPQKLLTAIPEHCTLFHTGSLALVPSAVDALLPVFETLTQQNTIISIDINARKGVVQDHQSYVDAVHRTLKYANIVKVSDEDLVMIGYDGCQQQACNTLLELMPANAIIALTLGEDGAHLITKNDNVFSEVYPVKAYADTIGAGDTFFANLLGYLMSQELLHSNNKTTAQLQAMLNFATIAATLNIEQTGCNPPTKAQTIKEANISQWDIGQIQ